MLRVRGLPRNEIVHQIYAKVSDLLVVSNGATKSCINCTHFDEPTETCKLFNARPPARVIALSCERYDDVDSIPF